MQRTNVIIGLVFVIVALAVALLLVPFDVETSYFEKHRRQLNVGDSLAPTLAAAFILFGGLLLIMERCANTHKQLSWANFRYLLLFLLIILFSLSLMRWTGPLVTGLLNLFTADDLEYRPLRDTTPWKHLGFFFGGGFLIASLISLVDGKMTIRAVSISVIAIFAMIAVYDLPFDDLLLPPNGDV